MGTKEVLYQTQHMGWGCDTQLYHSLSQMWQELPLRLANGQARVLKQIRGHSGSGVWKIEAVDPEKLDPSLAIEQLLLTEIPVRVCHAERDSIEQIMTLSEFFDRCEIYFEASGKMIDQEYQTRLPEGIIRCYLVHDKVAGFGHQAINALYPAPTGVPPTEAPQPGPRLYHPPDLADFQALKQELEQEWVPELQKLLDISTDRLPILWDADFPVRSKR
jgi:hypothetical protein